MKRKTYLDYGQDKVDMIRDNINICTERAARQHAQDSRRSEVTPKEKQKIRETFKQAIWEHDRMRNIKRGVK